jgi:glycerol-3-phosphate dehydrogenase
MREESLQTLSSTQFDLLVIGGGGTGGGVAVDAAARGLKVALVERYDFAEGTSSRSTKLVHGGVRYLEAAIKRLDRAQYNLVREALHERGVFLRNAPHLSNRLPLVTPLYSWVEVPYVFAGLKIYDLLSGSMNIGHSTLVGRKEALRRFPLLKREGLKAAVIYYDGQFDDSRMAVTLALSAQTYGAVVANHVEVIDLEKQAGKLCGARVRDRLGGGEFSIRARGVVNAAGPFVDRLRRMDEPSAVPVLKAASGIHIVLSARFLPQETGLLIPKTDDGRVLFILPWHGRAVIGTTDTPAEIVDHPAVKEEEVEYLLRYVNKYFDAGVKRSDVTAAWCGLRPLIRDEGGANTAQLVREHKLEVSSAGLLSVAGGKWTSYRRMAEEAVDLAVGTFGLRPARPCITNDLRLIGGESFNSAAEYELVRDYGLVADIAHRLHLAYGDRARSVAELAGSGLKARLHPDHPYIEAEVVQAARYEFAEHAADTVTRRLPLALLDTAAAKATLPRIVELMADEHGWDRMRCESEMADALQRLNGAI